jgi:hypothetical protein
MSAAPSKDTVASPIPYAGITRIRFEGSSPHKRGISGSLKATPMVNLSIVKK